MKVMIKRPGKTPEIREIDGSLESLQGLAGMHHASRARPDESGQAQICGSCSDRDGNSHREAQDESRIDAVG